MEASNFADALVGTRYREPIRVALRLVFVEGKSQSDAARITGMSRQQINEAVKSFQKKYEK